MSKTAQLRKLIRSQLQTVAGETYHKASPKDARYPYKCFTLTSVNFANPDRDDQELEVDIWDRAPDQKTAEEIADQVEKLFDGVILPLPPLYPAFFRDARFNLDDPDKELQHIQLLFTVQLHEKEE